MSRTPFSNVNNMHVHTMIPKDQNNKIGVEQTADGAPSVIDVFKRDLRSSLVVPIKVPNSYMNNYDVLKMITIPFLVFIHCLNKVGVFNSKLNTHTQTKQIFTNVLLIDTILCFSFRCSTSVQIYQTRT